MYKTLEVQKSILQIGLQQTVEKFKLDCKNLGHKVMLKYNQINSSNMHEEVRESRGLVLDSDTWEVMSMPFKRFYTHDDYYAAKLDLTKTVFTEKRDGTLIQVYWDYITKSWAINTMFSECEDKFFGGEYTLKEIFLNIAFDLGFSFNYLDSETTYIFELTSPYKKVVVKYETPELRLIGARYLLGDLKEHNFEKLCYTAERIKIPIVETYKFSSIEECLKSFQGKSYNFEGYVAFDGLNRIKIKNPAYVAIHLTKRSQDEFLDVSNPHIFLDIVKQNEIGEFSSSFPHAKELIEDLYEKYNDLLRKLHSVDEEIEKPFDDSAEAKKAFSASIMTTLAKYGIKSELSSLFFMKNNGKILSIEEYLQKYDNKKLLKILKNG